MAGTTSKYGIERLAVGRSTVIPFKPQLEVNHQRKLVQRMARHWRARYCIYVEVTITADGILVKRIESPKGEVARPPNNKPRKPLSSHPWNLTMYPRSKNIF